jgi:hypothetical protein
MELSFQCVCELGASLVDKPLGLLLRRQMSGRYATGVLGVGQYGGFHGTRLPKFAS